MKYTIGTARVSQSDRSYGDNTPDCTRIMGIFTFSEFWKFIKSELPQSVQVEMGGYELDKILLPKAKAYYRRASQLAASEGSKDSEQDLTCRALHQLATFGDVVHEDTSDSVSDHSTKRRAGKHGTDVCATEFRRSAYPYSDTVEGESGRADILCRLATPADLPHNSIVHGNTRYEYSADHLCAVRGCSDARFVSTCRAVPIPVLPHVNGISLATALPSYRSIPANTVYIKELKNYRENINNNKYIRQTSHYGEAILRVSPRRWVVFGALTNLNSVIFTAVVLNCSPRDGSRHYLHYCTEMITHTFIKELSHFVCLPIPAYGLLFRFPVEHISPTCYRGEGSTGAVYEATIQSVGLTLPIKISVQASDLLVERILLSYGERAGVQCIPRLNAAAQSEVSRADRCGNYCNVYQESYETLADKDFTLTRALALWKILRALHSIHVVHRDIRPPNVMLSSDQRVVLIDFSSARIIEGEEHLVTDPAVQRAMSAGIAKFYEPRPVNTSSDEVLRGKPTLPPDEGSSLIYCFLQAKFPKVTSFKAMYLGQIEQFIRFRDKYTALRMHAQARARINAIRSVLAVLESQRETLRGEELEEVVKRGLAAVSELSDVVAAGPTSPDPDEIEGAHGAPAADLEAAFAIMLSKLDFEDATPSTATAAPLTTSTAAPLTTTTAAPTTKSATTSRIPVLIRSTARTNRDVRDDLKMPTAATTVDRIEAVLAPEPASVETAPHASVETPFTRAQARLRAAREAEKATAAKTIHKKRWAL